MASFCEHSDEVQHGHECKKKDVSADRANGSCTRQSETSARLAKAASLACVLADVVEYARVVVAEQPSQSGGERDPAEVHGEIDTVFRGSKQEAQRAHTVTRLESAL